MQKNNRKSAFTLIELSIVLVIIGLIIGGVLVGQDLVNAATIRAQISQIYKYNTAVRTFQLKYGYLPGDIPDPAASAFGFIQRGQYRGEGDGNGILEGSCWWFSCTSFYTIYWPGYEMAPASTRPSETLVFWADLSKAGLIEGTFTYPQPWGGFPAASSSTSPSLNSYLPVSKIGSSVFVYVFNGGSNLLVQDGFNYFGIAQVTQLYNSSSSNNSSNGLTVNQAFNIDTKIDDGLPQSGNVFSMYTNMGYPMWSNVGFFAYGATTISTNASSTTCYDNSNSASSAGQNGVTQHYSLGVGASPSAVNCALSFKFQ